MRAAIAILPLTALFLVACSGSPEADHEPAPSPSIVLANPGLTLPMYLKCDEAIQIAKDRAAHLIAEGDIQKVSPDAQACARKAQAPLENRGTWFITLRGLLYEPSGPPAPDAPESSPLLPVCSEIAVTVDDLTGQTGSLTFKRATVCE